jgi:hypothetical protein
MSFSITRHKRPASIIALTGGLAFLGLGGVIGGSGFLLDPSGSFLQLSTSMLGRLPVRDFTLPGFFLLTVMGIIPLIIAYGLWRRPAWRRVCLFRHWVPRPSWLWAGTLAISIVLLLWLGLEFLLFGSLAVIPIYVAMLILGIVMLALALVPSTRQYCLGTRARRRRRSR